MGLTYNGSGEHITGVPAQDLTQDDITRLAGDFNLSEQATIDLLCSRGLYSAPKPTPKRKTKTDEDED